MVLVVMGNYIYGRCMCRSVEGLPAAQTWWGSFCVEAACRVQGETDVSGDVSAMCTCVLSKPSRPNGMSAPMLQRQYQYAWTCHYRPKGHDDVAARNTRHADLPLRRIEKSHVRRGHDTRISATPRRRER